MALIFFKNKSGVIAVILLAAIFGFSLFKGLAAGKNNSHSEYIFSVQQEILKGLDYFYEDQNRFPSQEEFLNSEIMLRYFSVMPGSISNSSICPQNFIYKKINSSSYQLDYCLDSDINTLSKGWRTEVINK
jgi:hypothetical protein